MWGQKVGLEAGGGEHTGDVDAFLMVGGIFTGDLRIPSCFYVCVVLRAYHAGNTGKRKIFPGHGGQEQRWLGQWARLVPVESGVGNRKNKKRTIPRCT